MKRFIHPSENSPIIVVSFKPLCVSVIVTYFEDENFSF